MCKDCGCSTATHKVFAHNHDHFHHEHEHQHQLEHLHQTEGASVKTRTLSIEESIFQKNQKLAEQNRQAFHSLGLRVINVMSSPGSGKTSLLARLLPEINKLHKLAVVVGDQETQIDADRLKHAGLLSVQINTHSSCHLDAHRVAHAMELLPLQKLEWIVIENVGNLVCPAVFDLGESIKVALLSTPEGEEKPLKYPVLFHDADLIIVTKSDLIPHLDYDVELVNKNIRTLNSRAPILFCSVKTNAGIDSVKEGLLALAQSQLQSQPNSNQHHHQPQVTPHVPSHSSTNY